MTDQWPTPLPPALQGIVAGFCGTVAHFAQQVYVAEEAICWFIDTAAHHCDHRCQTGVALAERGSCSRSAR